MYVLCVCVCVWVSMLKDEWDSAELGEWKVEWDDMTMELFAGLTPGDLAPMVEGKGLLNVAKIRQLHAQAKARSQKQVLCSSPSQSEENIPPRICDMYVFCRKARKRNS